MTGETASANVNQRQRQRWRTVGGHANRRWTILALSKLSLRGKVRFVGDFRLDGRANEKAPVSSLAFFSLAVRSQRSPSGSQGPAAAAGSWLQAALTSRYLIPPPPLTSPTSARALISSRSRWPCLLQWLGNDRNDDSSG
ncbi:LOW QUALITY PROTEIN: hypothetical protein N5P37_005723 [Trichoderma harzianum]|nr:LOW QUALITY PROTEIN: hypothetical protein N5P37_005723 [Trichoderma harzianum]